jgi:hypothetical protein
MRNNVCTESLFHRDGADPLHSVDRLLDLNIEGLGIGGTSGGEEVLALAGFVALNNVMSSLLALSFHTHSIESII